MDAIEVLIKDLRSANIRIWSDGRSIKYDAPSGALNPHLRQRISNNKKSLISRLGSSELGDVGLGSIPVTGELPWYPVSSQQRRFYILQKMNPESTAYNMTMGYSLQVAIAEEELGELREDLEETAREMIARHESFRTSFRFEKDELVQVVDHFVDFDIECERKIGASVTSLKKEFTRPFRLECAPLLRVKLIYRGKYELPLVLFDMHHIVSDGVSIAALFNELEIIAGGFELPEIRLNYRDYAVWQQSSLNKGILRNQQSYWLEQFSSEPPLLELPYDFRRPDERSFEGGAIECQLDQELTASLRGFARDHGVTMYMVLLSVLKIVLSKYTNQEDVVVGTAIAGRDHQDIENIIGVFVNTLAIRSRPAGEKRYCDYLDEVKSIVLGAFENQHYPFEELVENVVEIRDTKRNPLFDVLLNFHNMERFNFDSEKDILLLPEVMEVDRIRFDLQFNAWETEDSIFLTILYSLELFAKERIQEIGSQFISMVRQICNRTDLTLSEYSLGLENANCNLPIPTANLDRPCQEPVEEAFLRWCDATPDAIALRDECRELSYGELCRMAMEVASVLPSDRKHTVAVYGDLNVSYFVAMLGVFISGNIVLTLDKNVPDTRLKKMIAKASASILLSCDADSRDVGWLRELAWGRRYTLALDGVITCIETNETFFDSTDEQLQDPDATYIFFTSGSTGEPKGILGSGQGLAHFLSWQRDKFEIGPGDLCAQLTSPGFDVLLRDVLLPLVSGATLCLPPKDARENPAGILAWAAVSQITVMHVVPSLSELWLQKFPSGLSLHRMRWVFHAGEPLGVELLSRWKGIPDFNGAIVNLYGPTETTLAKSAHILEDSASPFRIPVGQSLPNSQLLVVSPAGLLCGIGEIGEIAVRTPFASLGYLGGEKGGFRSSPFDSSEEIFFTGDLGRYAPTGDLEIIGRKDFQIKIRGVRIEPSEISEVLKEHPDVAMAVVVGDRYQNGVTLISYVSLVDGAKTLEGELLRHCRERLLGAMVPSRVIILSELPLLHNGKIDRQSLPKLESLHLVSGDDYAAAKSEVELGLAVIWQDILGVERVGINDCFFDLGGHSLNALQCIERMAEVLGARVSIRDLMMESLEDISNIYSEK